MNRFSRLLALALALCMVIGALPITASAAEDTLNYVSVGDSAASGHGLDGYFQNSDDRAVYDFMTGKGMYGNDAYPLQFEAYLTELGYEVNHTKLATSAMLAEDLLYLLGGREEFDDGWNGYKDYVGTYSDDALMPYAQKAIAQADVITFHVGNDAFGAFLLQKLSAMAKGEKVDFNFEDAISVLELDAEQNAFVMQMYSTLENELIHQIPGRNVEVIMDFLSYTAASFVVNYRLLLEHIMTVNPDVQIILVGLSNTTQGMNITDANGNVLLSFGDALDKAFEMLNAYVAGIPAYLQSAGEYPEATLYYAAPSGNQSVDSGMFVCPTAEGHKEIARNIISAYKSHTVQSQTQENMKQLLQVYGPEVARYALKLWAERESNGLGNQQFEYLALDSASTYVALGDGTAASKSYVDKLAAQLAEKRGTRNYVNYAKPGNTVAEEMINIGSYAAIGDADLITVGFGNVTLLSNAFENAMYGEGTAYDWAELLGEENVSYVENILVEVYAKTAAIGLDEETTAMVNSVIEGVAFGAAEYALKLPQLIAAIREVNKDAAIVIVGQYNPMDGVVLKFGDTALDFADYINYFVEGVALHGTAYCAVSREAIFVEAPGVEISNSDMEWTIADLARMLMKGFSALYPSQEGHTYIAGEILDALNLDAPIPVEPEVVLGDSNGDGKVNLKDAILVLKSINGGAAVDTISSDVNKDNKVNLKDAILILKFVNGTPFPAEK